jgi:hypothetical protein
MVEIAAQRGRRADGRSKRGGQAIPAEGYRDHAIAQPLPRRPCSMARPMP